MQRMEPVLELVRGGRGIDCWVWWGERLGVPVVVWERREMSWVVVVVGEGGSRSGAGDIRVLSARFRAPNRWRIVLLMTSPFALRTSESMSSSSAGRVLCVESAKAC